MVLASACPAIVYTLRTGGQSIAERIDAKTVLKETITVNGHAGLLEVAVTQRNWEETVAALADLIVGPAPNAEQRALFIETPGAEGRLVRHYIMSLQAGAARATAPTTKARRGSA